MAGQDDRRPTVRHLHGPLGVGRVATGGKLPAGVGHPARVVLLQASPGWKPRLSLEISKITFLKNLQKFHSQHLVIGYLVRHSGKNELHELSDIL